ncbi:hypothetical protein M0Q97_11845 [Candidatus Dojkabacteria bacterium]|jgi:hypothetical protein|nr:hypothetical protein [Candidatus Dojkabacteria bacterium]
MKITSFDGKSNIRLKRDTKQKDLFNLFQKNLVLNENIIVSNLYIVPLEYEMRLDKISNFLYGSPDYTEELMIMNNITNPYSVLEGQYIYYCDYNSLSLFYTIDPDITSSTRDKLISSSQTNNKTKPTNDKNLPVTVKPSNLNQITVTKDNKVKIINSFE